jgi:molecular chaperone Hsp33
LGRVPLQSGEIGDDLAYYFAVSEQLPSAVGLGVLVNTDDRVAAAGGYLIQLLPGASEAVIAHLEANITAAPRPSDLILHLRDPARVLDVLLDGLGWRELARLTPRYSCGCTRAKSRRALAALPALELRQMAAGDEPAEVLCEFCGKRYRFTPAEMAGLTVRKI